MVSALGSGGGATDPTPWWNDNIVAARESQIRVDGGKLYDGLRALSLTSA